LGRNRHGPAGARRRFRPRGCLRKCAAMGQAKQDSRRYQPPEHDMTQRYCQIPICPSRCALSSVASIAFSSQVDTGSRKENASNKRVEPGSDSIRTEKL
jgi:hypothetical protein